MRPGLRVENADLLCPAVLTLLESDPVALCKGLGEVDHESTSAIGFRNIWRVLICWFVWIPPQK